MGENSEAVAGERLHALDLVRAGALLLGIVFHAALPFMTVSQAIAAAGGLEKDAARNSVLVFHRDGARTVRVERVRLDHGLKRADLDDDPMLSRFDIVYVPRNTLGNLSIFTNGSLRRWGRSGDPPSQQPLRRFHRVFHRCGYVASPQQNYPRRKKGFFHEFPSPFGAFDLPTAPASTTIVMK